VKGRKKGDVSDAGWQEGEKPVGGPPNAGNSPEANKVAPKAGKSRHRRTSLGIGGKRHRQEAVFRPSGVGAWGACRQVDRGLELAPNPRVMNRADPRRRRRRIGFSDRALYSWA